MPRDSTITIGGRRWRLTYTKLPSGRDADCDPPERRCKVIRLRPSLKQHPRLLLEALLHEGTHAADFTLPEGFVEMLARDLTRVLWSQGFRLVATENE